ncbi:hypothetical protein HPP92_017614 [Vanilla planifolia]|uniref:Uncharacterized protein n=1 Tax=Vanilla planifolia TaxID=51239 RepID=A0A835QED0_VANPL|nr:hypothetical protein HPP92_017614 [Vanilla planifolia]
MNINAPWFSCTGNVNLKQDDNYIKQPSKAISTKLVTSCWKSSNGDLSSELIFRLPVPYKLPPQPYSPEDVPWSWDRQYTHKDVYGYVWP